MTAIKHFKWCRVLPVILSVGMMIGTAIIYVLAATRNDVPWFIPYISDTGGSPPESGIFAILLVTASFISIIIVTLRYYSVRNAPGAENLWLIWINRIGLATGTISAGGTVVVAAYPVHVCPILGDWYKDVMVPHQIGALMAFFVGCIYLTLQTILTCLMRANYTGHICIIVTRVVFNISAILAFILMMSLGGHAASTDASAKCTRYNPHPVITTSPIPHLSSALPANINTTGPAKLEIGIFEISIPESATTTTTPETTTPNPELRDAKKDAAIFMEWVLAFSVFCYYITFYSEFKHVVVKIFVFPFRDAYHEHENRMCEDCEG